MFLTTALLAKKVKAKHIMICMESLVSGHRVNTIRERLGDKLEFIRFDPYIGQESVYREVKKVRSMSAKFKPTDRKLRPVSIYALE